MGLRCRIGWHDKKMVNKAIVTVRGFPIGVHGHLICTRCSNQWTLDFDPFTGFSSERLIERKEQKQETEVEEPIAEMRTNGNRTK